MSAAGCELGVSESVREGELIFLWKRKGEGRVRDMYGIWLLSFGRPGVNAVCLPVRGWREKGFRKFSFICN